MDTPCPVCHDDYNVWSFPIGAPELRAIIPCPACQCHHQRQTFDRTVCPEPCGSMHYYCNDCGQRTDHCAWENP